MEHQIVFATNNRHKLKEIQDLLGTEFRLLSLSDIGFSGDIPEEQPTLEGNALDKARFIYQFSHQPCFADDTGLETEALDGRPGVFSARYAGSLAGFGSEEKRSEANVEKLLQELLPFSNRKARFRTVIAYIDGSREYLFEGTVDGEIISHKKGAGGFGYDPVFMPSGFDQTFAQMPLSEKNKISHRARAFAKFIEFLKASK